jgi:hypothetical protein
VFLKAKLECLHFAKFDKPDDQLAMHRPLDPTLNEVLQSIKDHPVKLYIRNRRQDPHWINAASQCDRIRSFQKQKKYYHNASKGRVASQAGCVQANTLRALDMLQRHAYMEVKLSVYRAVGMKFPKKLAELVFMYTLAAEGIPQDPRIMEGPGDIMVQFRTCDIWVSYSEGDMSDV